MQPLFQSLKTIATLVNYTIRFRSFIKLTPGHRLQLTSVCTGTWSHWSLKKTKLLMLYILFCMHLLLSRPLVSYNLRQKPRNTLENSAPFVPSFLFPFAMLFQPRNIAITSQHCRGVSRTFSQDCRYVIILVTHNARLTKYI